jgi:hypothetical protein
MAPSHRNIPPVSFDHERHGKTVLAAGQDCFSCHAPLPAEHGAPAFSGFKAASGLKGDARAQAYHEACVSCHVGGELPAGGPALAECRACHAGPVPSLPDQDFVPRFNGSLHSMHLDFPVVRAEGMETARKIYPALADGAILGETSDFNCLGCHPPQTRAAPWPMGAAPLPPPDSCASCHVKGPGTGFAAPDGGKDLMSLTEAGHELCLSCHTRERAAERAAGPVQCSSCHDRAGWESYSAMYPGAARNVGQPAGMLLGSYAPEDPLSLEAHAAGWKQAMPPVLFNHRLHERNEDCASCHHSTVRRACSSCHTQEGSEDGNYVSLAGAMHSDNPRFTSCVSCHREVVETSPECAGCHAARPARSAGEACGFCHRPAPGPGDMPAFVSGRPAGTGSVKEIGRLSEEYGAVPFAHTAHVQRLADIIAERAPGMSAAHLKDRILCQSCHHNSPPDSIPECASCHPAALNAGGFPPDGRPLLKAAYHQLCMDCHTRMEVKAPPAADCTACHRPLPGRLASLQG